MIKIRKSGNIIVTTRNWYLKVPWRIYGLRENLQEIKNLQAVKNDSHFVRYLPSYKNFGPVIKVEKLSSIKEADFSSLLIPYFENAFKNKNGWIEVNLKELIAFDHLELFIKNLEDESLEKILEICKSIRIPRTSAHGDFHPENIMLDGDNNLKFIDWIRYNATSSRYFDLIDCAVFLGKQEEIWFNYWKSLYEKEILNFFEIEIKKEYLISYAIWKISEELKTLYQRKMLNKYKIKKYRNFLKIISELC